jgi:hypothetical protein
MIVLLIPDLPHPFLSLVRRSCKVVQIRLGVNISLPETRHVGTRAASEIEVGYDCDLRCDEKVRWCVDYALGRNGGP